LLVTINKAREKMYWDAKGNIFNVLKNSLQKSLDLALINCTLLKFKNIQAVDRGSPED
jgi:hypothetical protein